MKPNSAFTKQQRDNCFREANRQPNSPANTLQQFLFPSFPRNTLKQHILGVKYYETKAKTQSILNNLTFPVSTKSAKRTGKRPFHPSPDGQLANSPTC
jgi:hypothetical protein